MRHRYTLTEFYNLAFRILSPILYAYASERRPGRIRRYVFPTALELRDIERNWGFASPIG